MTNSCPQCGTSYGAGQRFCPHDGSPLSSPPAGTGLVGQVIADRYRVVRKLGEGGMGEVYLAEHVRMGRKSALKIMRPSMTQDPDAIGRFNREASNASRISHPNVAAIYDFGETADGLIYLAMEFVDGTPLGRILANEAPLAAGRAANIARQVGEALTAAHDLGIVHRDLKPDNVMVARGRDGSDVVKVVDFGIAKQTDGAGQKVTRTGLLVGTPEYMSPEQLAGDPLDPRSDVYSLALVLFAMLTGTLPFPSVSAQQALVKRLTERPRTLAEARPDRRWSPLLQRALDRGLATTAAERSPTAAAFTREVDAALLATERRATAARAEAAPGPSSRRRVVSATGALVAAGMLIVVAAGWVVARGRVLPTDRIERTLRETDAIVDRNRLSGAPNRGELGAALHHLRMLPALDQTTREHLHGVLLEAEILGMTDRVAQSCGLVHRVAGRRFPPELASRAEALRQACATPVTGTP